MNFQLKFEKKIVIFGEKSHFDAVDDQKLYIAASATLSLIITRNYTKNGA